MNRELTWPRSGEELGSVWYYVALEILALASGLAAGFFFGWRTILLGAIVAIGPQVYFLVILYRLWRVVIEQAGAHGLTPSVSSPRRAVGFLFVPGFNIWWVFVAIGKLPKDLNAVASACGSGERIPEDMGRTVIWMSWLQLIPLYGIVFWFILLIGVPIFIARSLAVGRTISYERMPA